MQLFNHLASEIAGGAIAPRGKPEVPIKVMISALIINLYVQPKQ